MPANAGIHVFLACGKTWMAGTGPAMTALQAHSLVMPAKAGIHVFLACGKTWMAGTSPAMTG